MDVRMPDGTIIQNVPDNMSQSELMQSLHGAGYDTTAFSMAKQAAKPAAPAAKPAAPTKVPWTAADYAGAAGRAVANLPGDVMQLGGELMATGRDVVGGLMPWNLPSSARTVVAAGSEAAKTVAGEIELGMRKLGLPSKPAPGKEQYLEDLVSKAKQLNTFIDESALAQAVRGDFGPLLTSIADRPAHAALNAGIGLRSLAGAAEKAGYASVAARLNAAAKAVDPFALPGKAGQAARAAAGKGAEMTSGKTSQLLGAVSTMPTIGEATTNMLARAASGATNWAGRTFDPQSTWLRKIYGEDLEKGREMLATGEALSETGAPLTMAERTQGLGRVEIPAAEAQLVAAKAPTPWSRREAVRKEQMRRQLSPLAANMDEAVEAREAATASDYAAVRAKTVSSSTKLESLLERARAAVAKAEEAAKIEGREFSKSIAPETFVEHAYGVKVGEGGRSVSVGGTRIDPATGKPVLGAEIPGSPVTGQGSVVGGQGVRIDPVTGKPVLGAEIPGSPVTGQGSVVGGQGARIDPVTGKPVPGARQAVITDPITGKQTVVQTPAPGTNIPVTGQTTVGTGVVRIDPATGKRIVGPATPGATIPVAGASTVGAGAVRIDPATGKRIVGPATPGQPLTTPKTTVGGEKPSGREPKVTYAGQSLEQVDRALGELSNLPQATGMTGTIAKSLKGLQAELRAYLTKEGGLPELGRAVENYASHSRRIDRIKVGEFLSDLATKQDAAGESQFLKYWVEARKGNAGQLIKDATGDATYSTLTGENSIGFNRTEMRRFENVAKEIERRKEYARQASAGAGADITVGESIKGLPHTLNQPGMFANVILKATGEHISKKTANRLAELVFKPGNEDLLAAFDKAIATKNRGATAAAYMELKARQAGALGKKAAEAYSTIEAQTLRNMLDPRVEYNQNSLNR